MYSRLSVVHVKVSFKSFLFVAKILSCRLVGLYEWKKKQLHIYSSTFSFNQVGQNVQVYQELIQYLLFVKEFV